jgi:hypothetical protein
MSQASRVGLTLGAIATAMVITSGHVFTQAADQPTNDLPNPYQTIEGWAKLPAGRTWGSTSAVEVDKDGRSIWVGERCGANSCLDRATGQIKPENTILKFDSNGNLVTSFGGGMLIFPHGIHTSIATATSGSPTARTMRRCRRPRRPVPHRRRRSRAWVRRPGPPRAIRSTSSARTASCC